jgi:hypothetical protein
MKKSILNLGAKELTKNEQNTVNGGTNRCRNVFCLFMSAAQCADERGTYNPSTGICRIEHC